MNTIKIEPQFTKEQLELILEDYGLLIKYMSPSKEKERISGIVEKTKKQLEVGFYK